MMLEKDNARLESENALLRNPWRNCRDDPPAPGVDVLVRYGYRSYEIMQCNFGEWTCGRGEDYAPIEWMSIPKAVSDERNIMGDS